MVTRIIVSTVAASFVTLLAFGQTKYSRTRAPSPTPTPTPLPLIAPKEASLRPQTQPQRTSPTPAKRAFSQPQKTLVTPTPSTQTFAQPQKGMQRPTPIPTPAKQTYLQPQKITPTPTPMPQQKMAPRSVQIQPKQSPTPLPRTMQSANQPKVTPIPAQIQPRVMPTPTPVPMKPTPTPVPPPDVKAYLDKQLASSKDKKFHLNANGKDIALTPFHVWPQKSTGFNTTSTSVSMRSDEGGVYDIDFLTTGKDVTGIKVRRINGEAVR